MTSAEFNKQAQLVADQLFTLFNGLAKIAEEVSQKVRPHVEELNHLLVRLQDPLVAERSRQILYFLEYLLDDPSLFNAEELMSDLERRGEVEVVRLDNRKYILSNRRIYYHLELDEYGELLRYSQVKRILSDIDVK